MNSATLTKVSILVLLGAIVLFALYPGLDLATAHLFYGPGGFVGQSPAGDVGRKLCNSVPLLLLAGLSLLYLAGRLSVLPAHFAPRGRSIVFLVLSLGLGPGLVVNGILKETSHRPRPVQVSEFGGAFPFRPFYRFDGACEGNCSFPSGEAATAFWTAAPASLAPPPLRLIAIAAALLFGAATGGLRLAFGGHFLSDVVFAGLLSVLVIMAVRRLLPDTRRSPPAGSREKGRRPSQQIRSD